MTQNELKLVFDALQECTTYAVAGGFGKRATAHRDALAILEKALAQPEQEPFCFFYVENGEEYFAPKGAYVPDNAQPLYTATPQRTWVGLTEQQRNDIENDFEVFISIHVFDAIEAKLKDKNS